METFYTQLIAMTIARMAGMSACSWRLIHMAFMCIVQPFYINTLQIYYWGQRKAHREYLNEEPLEKKALLTIKWEALP